MKRVFRGWLHIVREERSLEWEKIARARRFRERSVLTNAISTDTMEGLGRGEEGA